MRIDGIFGYEPYRVSDKSKAGERPGKSSRSVSAGPQGSAVSGAQSKYVNQALSAAEVNASAIAEARRLVASGELDTSEAADRVAARILDLGF